jgi:hypothetical protein
MNMLSSLINDDIKAKYKNTQFYLKNGVFLFVKCMLMFLSSLLFTFFVFSILTPSSYNYSHQPYF